MQFILKYWIRTYNVSLSFPSDLLNLIVEVYTFQEIFDTKKKRDASMEYLTFKTVIVGEYGVGKTHIHHRYIHKVFAEPMTSNLSYDFMVKMVRIEGVRAKIQFWDTSSQERFGMLHHAFYRRCDGIVLVYDIHDRHSFERLKHWNEELLEWAPKDVRKIVVGNKCDLKSENAVTLEEAQMFCKEMEIPYCFEISAKNGYQIKEAMHSLEKLLIHPYVRADKPFYG